MRTYAEWGRVAISLVEAARSARTAGPDDPAWVRAAADVRDELLLCGNNQEIGFVFAAMLKELAGLAGILANNWQHAAPDFDVADWLQRLSLEAAMNDDGTIPTMGGEFHG